jgi:xanthine dehydrogenase accessory factor
VTRIWIQGAGEMASGVAVVLVRAGYSVVLAERSSPLAVRRRVCFSSALRRGHTFVEEVVGRLATLPPAEVPPNEVVVVVDPNGTMIPLWRPGAVVDARMTKRVPGPLPCGTALRIGLGPGFVAGGHVDLVVETHRPAGPGRLIENGTAAPDTGIPGSVGGRTASRLVRAPVAGSFRPSARIGDLVSAGQELGRVAGRPVTAGLAGLVRGLVASGTELSAGEKVGDIDPRGTAVDPTRISDKALAIGHGVRAGLKKAGRGPEMNRRS